MVYTNRKMLYYHNYIDTNFVLILHFIEINLKKILILDQNFRHLYDSFVFTVDLTTNFTKGKTQGSSQIETV